MSIRSPASRASPPPSFAQHAWLDLPELARQRRSLRRQRQWIVAIAILALAVLLLLGAGLLLRWLP